MALELLPLTATADMIADKVASFKLLTRAKGRNLWKMGDVKIGPMHKAEYIKAVLALDIPVHELIQDINLLILTRKHNLETALQILEGFIYLVQQLAPKAATYIPDGVLQHFTAKVVVMYSDLPERADVAV
jgi:hypothetical protein